MEHAHLYGIAPIPEKGMGLRAMADIPCNTTVMTCAAIEVSVPADVIPFSIAQYLFVSPEQFEKSNGSCHYRIVCGDMVFLNHSMTPNCNVSWFRDQNNVLFATLVSTGKIKSGSELTIRYTDACNYHAHGYL